MRIILIAEHASFRLGGEATLPLHYFMRLRARGFDAWLITHERTRDELQALLPNEASRILYIKDRMLHRGLWQITRRLPARIGYITTGYISRLATQIEGRRMVRRLVREAPGEAIVHQVIPVSPREPSILHNLGAPVVIGPMNGHLAMPPAFGPQPRLPGLSARLAQRLFPGKRDAVLLMFANERSRLGLPEGPAPQAILAENGVDMRLWTPAPLHAEGPPRFLFIGRLVDWKAVHLLPKALARMKNQSAVLEIIGDGPMRSVIEATAREMGVASRVQFRGWLSQAECVNRLHASRALLLPSLMECGGAVVLEAMACARPAIATAWGGPLDYITPGTGILVEPSSEDALISGFAAAMDWLATFPNEAEALGQAAHAHVLKSYDWESKIDAVVGFYTQALLARRPAKR